MPDHQIQEIPIVEKTQPRESTSEAAMPPINQIPPDTHA